MLYADASCQGPAVSLFGSVRDTARLPDMEISVRGKKKTYCLAFTHDLCAAFSFLARQVRCIAVAEFALQGNESVQVFQHENYGGDSVTLPAMLRPGFYEYDLSDFGHVRDTLE